MSELNSSSQKMNDAGKNDRTTYSFKSSQSNPVYFQDGVGSQTENADYVSTMSLVWGIMMF